MEPKFKLEDLKRGNVYNVPENYFDKLPNQIMQRVTTTPEVSGVKGVFSKQLRLALAGSGFAAIFATVFLLTSNPATTNTDLLTQVPETEIVNYILASEQLDRTDLTSLNLPEQNLTSEFINANDSEIKKELEEAPIEDLYL